MTWFGLYFDEDSMWAARAAALRAVGWDVLTALEAETLGLSDEQQLEFATERRRVLVTANARDFGQINARWLSAGRDHAGIIVARQSDAYSPGEFARRMLRLGSGLEPAQLANQVHHLSSYGARG